MVLYDIYIYKYILVLVFFLSFFPSFLHVCQYRMKNKCRVPNYVEIRRKQNSEFCQVCSEFARLKERRTCFI